AGGPILRRELSPERPRRVSRSKYGSATQPVSSADIRRHDDEARAVGGSLDYSRRPRKPALVFRHNVKEDVAVHQYGRHSIVAGQRHDGVAAHRNIAASSQMGGQERSPTVLVPGLGEGASDAFALTLSLNIRGPQHS